MRSHYAATGVNRAQRSEGCGGAAQVEAALAGYAPDWREMPRDGDWRL